MPKIIFLLLFDVFDDFGPFLRSWRPGNASKSILEAIRFDSTEYEPVGRHGDPKRINFHHNPDQNALLAGCGALMHGCRELISDRGALMDGCGPLMDGC